MSTKIDSLWNDFVDILFPMVCPACSAVLTGTEYEICTKCLVELPKGTAVGMMAGETSDKFAAFDAVKSAQAFLEYHPKGKVQSLLHNLKYQGNQSLGEFLGRVCAEEWRRDLRMPVADLIVPVPLHTRKLKERGFNQSEAFGRGLSDVCSIPLDGTLLQRDRYTLSQTGKSKTGRIEDMQGGFSIRPGVELGRLRIILVDDVLTTGATLEACVEVLIAGGCRNIHIITIAATQS